MTNKGKNTNKTTRNIHFVIDPSVGSQTFSLTFDVVSKDKDKTKKCSQCKSHKTYFRNSTNRFDWRTSNKTGKCLCKRCYCKEYYKGKKEKACCKPAILT